jgi:hypothetical protein
MGTNETTELADLALTNGQQAEVKGGPTLAEYGLQIAIINPSTTSTTAQSNGNLQIAQFTR